MPDSQYNLLPELLVREQPPLLPYLIGHWIPQSIGLIDISLEHKGKEALKAGEDSVVKHGEPFEEEELPWEATEVDEVQLGQD